MSGASDRRLFGGRAAPLLALLCCLLWGSAFPCIKIGYDLFGVVGDDTGSQLLFAGCRFALAGILVIAAGSLLTRRVLRPARRDLPPIALLALTQTAAQYIFFYIGLAHANGVNASIVNGSGACITVLMACFVFRCEKFTLAKGIGCALGFAGVLLLNISGGKWQFVSTGEGLVLLSAVAAATSAILIKRFSGDHDPVLLSGWQFFCGGIGLIAVGLIGGGRLAPTGLAAPALLLYLGFLSAAAYTLWGLLLQQNPVSRITAYDCSIPLFGALLSAWWLQETDQLLRWQVPAALALVVAGVLVIDRGAVKRKAE